MVKGLAKLGNRLRHGRWAKCVDVSLFGGEERLLPNDACIVTVIRVWRKPHARIRPMSM